MNQNFQFLQNPDIVTTLKEVESLKPQESEIYLIGGSVRNAIFHKIFGEYLPQRDFDLVYFGEREKFEQNLLANNYEEGSTYSDFQKVFKKRIDDLSILTFECLILDIHFLPKQDLVGMLGKNVNFRFQGTTLPLSSVFSDEWFSDIVSIEGAVDDIKNKQIVVNTKKEQIHDTAFYAMLRFLSFSFQKPTTKEVQLLLEALKRVPEDRLERNKDKVLGSVGSEEKLQEILKDLGIQGDIFSYEDIQKGLNISFKL